MSRWAKALDANATSTEINSAIFISAPRHRANRAIDRIINEFACRDAGRSEFDFELDHLLGLGQRALGPLLHE